MVRRGKLYPWLLLAPFIASLWACGDGDVVLPRVDEPFLYLVLNERTRDAAISGTEGQHALLMTVESVLESPVFRSASRFDLREASDTVPFGWHQYEVAGLTVGSYPALSIKGWNFFLADSVAVGRRPAGDLEPGRSYSLTIETGGVTIRGTTVIPDTFSVDAIEGDGVRRLVWPSVSGAGGYRIEAENREVRLQEDTVWAVPDDLRLPDVTVVALDSNLFRYSVESQLPRAGIDAGLGVFGAISTGRRSY